MGVDRSSLQEICSLEVGIRNMGVFSSLSVGEHVRRLCNLGVERCSLREFCILGVDRSILQQICSMFAGIRNMWVSCILSVWNAEVAP